MRRIYVSRDRAGSKSEKMVLTSRLLTSYIRHELVRKFVPTIRIGRDKTQKNDLEALDVLYKARIGTFVDLVQTMPRKKKPEFVGWYTTRFTKQTKVHKGIRNKNSRVIHKKGKANHYISSDHFSSHQICIRSFSSQAILMIHHDLDF